jgi:hypothetical protein
MKQAPTVDTFPERRPGESAAVHERRCIARLIGDGVRSKGDNKEWTGSPPFHLSHE